MSKVVRAVVGIGLIITGIFMGGTTWPLAVMALGGGIAATALQPKPTMPSVSEATAGRLNKSLEPECFRKIAFGRTALGTDTRYWEVYGSAEESYDEVIALAGHEISSFDALYVEDELVSFDGSGNATGRYAGALSMKSELVGTSGSTLSGVGAGSKWATASGESASMTGMAYMVLKWVWSQEKLPRGFPTRITPVGSGAMVYDPRLDTTNGGTGTHRADDQSTWEHTPTDSNGEAIGRNPALQILHYLLGWYIQNPDTSEWVLVHGMGIDPDDIDFASFITAANECEAEGYYADCLLSTGDNHATNLGVLEQACAGKVSDAGGRYALRIMVDDFDGSLVEFTDDDIVGECDWRPEMPLAQSAYNQIAGQFIDPDALYQLRPLPLMRDTAYETADGEKVRTNVRLDAVQDGDQAQKLLRIRLNKSRQKGMFEAPFGWRAVNVSVGQPIKLTLSRFGFDERYFRVRAKKTDPGGAVWMALETDHPDVYTGGTISTLPTVSTGAGYDPASVPTPTSDEWEGEGGTIIVEDGAQLPSVTITAGDTTQPTSVTGILIYTCQASNSGPWDFQGEYPAGTEQFVLSGLLADETYYVRIMYRNAFGVIDTSSALILGPYTTGESVSTRAVGSVTQDDIDTALAFLASANPELAGGLSTLTQAGAINRVFDPLFTLGVRDNVSNTAPLYLVSDDPAALAAEYDVGTGDVLDIIFKPRFELRAGSRLMVGAEMTLTGPLAEASCQVRFFDADLLEVGAPVTVASAATGNRAEGFLEPDDIPATTRWGQLEVVSTATSAGTARLQVHEPFAAYAGPNQSTVEAFRDPQDEAVGRIIANALVEQSRVLQIEGLVYETAVSRAAVLVLQQVTANAARYQTSATYEGADGITYALSELYAADGVSRILQIAGVIALANPGEEDDVTIAMEVRGGIVHFLTEARLDDDAAFTHYTGDPEVLRICIGKHPSTGKVGIFLYDSAGVSLFEANATDEVYALSSRMLPSGTVIADASGSSTGNSIWATACTSGACTPTDDTDYDPLQVTSGLIPDEPEAIVEVRVTGNFRANADIFTWLYYKMRLALVGHTGVGVIDYITDNQYGEISCAQSTGAASGNMVSDNRARTIPFNMFGRIALPAAADGDRDEDGYKVRWDWNPDDSTVTACAEGVNRDSGNRDCLIDVQIEVKVIKA